MHTKEEFNSSTSYTMRAILFILILLISQICISQQIYFNSVLSNGSASAVGHSIQFHDEGYFISGWAGGGFKIGVFNITPEGDQVWIKKYGEDDQSWYDGWNGSFKRKSDGGFSIGGGVYKDGSNFGLLINLNDECDTTWSESYSGQMNSDIILDNCIPLDGGAFVLTGEELIEGNNSDVVLLKADSTGEEIWRSHFGWNTHERGYSLIQTSDNGFMIGGYMKDLETTTYSGNPLIVKFDSIGNYQWNKTIGGPFVDGVAMLCLDDDNNVAVLTSVADSMKNNDFAYSKIQVCKIDQEGNIIWCRKYGPSKLENYISNIKPLVNGGFICCGYNYIEDTAISSGWLLRLDSDGDSIWYKNYLFYSNYEDNNINILRDVLTTDDGGYISVGSADIANSPKKVWVLKVDSLGCDTPGCNTVGLPEALRENKNYLKVYPNPATETVNIQYPVGLSGGSLKVYNQLGVFKQELTIGANSNISLINIKEYQPGIYFICLLKFGQIIARTKFIVR